MVWSGNSVLKWFSQETLFWNGLVRKLCFKMVWFGNSVLKWFGQETLFLTWFGLETLFWNGLVWKLCFEMVWFGTGAWRMQEWNLSLQRRMEWQVGRFNSLRDYWHNSKRPLFNATNELQGLSVSSLFLKTLYLTRPIN